VKTWMMESRNNNKSGGASIDSENSAFKFIDAEQIESSTHRAPENSIFFSTKEIRNLN